MRKAALAAVVFVAAAISVVGGPKAHAESIQKPAKQPKVITIQSGDSLSKLAKKHDTTYLRLFYANKEIKDPDLIYAGNKLRVPDQNEKLQVRPLPGRATDVADSKPEQRKQPKAAAGSTWKPATTAPSKVSGSVWDRLAACESGGNWSINTGNGYFGGLQFSLSTWRAVGGVGYPHQASKAEQIKRGQILQARSGWGQWPACTSMLGLR